ncbi:MAG: universal stress protein [Pseudotabrizicola sp.]|uniref:universal stress protein n=1 Tax=Pseudotabrizicola sp. TaxID=2939647 RepID=UPI00273112F7|nr:universal stress protein [Pseudotabrizicola sp.]MDP2080330.1 universal stress protein [Pseudotabrizicola sp.]MDZ7572345.1 universal stress protein [Pseudotabrizicola sp.]
MLTSLLAASDLSSGSKPAVWRALLFAEAAQARHAVLHVVEDDQTEARLQEEMRSVQKYPDGQLAAFGKPKACDVFTRAGDAFQVISEVAQVCDADLIVLGAHGACSRLS